jgi:hypothetical protein
MKGLRLLPAMAGLACLLVLGAGQARADDVQHGIGFTKGCTSPVSVGGPYSCSYTVRNILDGAGDTLTITGLADVVHSAGGDVASGNMLGVVQLDNGGTTATCAAASGTGTPGNPWLGATSCTLPFGSRINVQSHSFYTVQAGDYALPGHQLRDDALLTWHDLCDDPLHTGNQNCDPNPPTVGASSLAVVNQPPSTTTTDIHDATHQIVTSVTEGSTVHDLITVSGVPGGPVPTGNVTLDWFANGACGGVPAASSSVGPLDAAGRVDATGFAQGPLAAGSYSFRAHYAGDSVYAGSDGPCEPLTVTPSGGGLITETNVACGDVLSGAAAGFVIGAVNYPSSGGKIGQGINPGKFYFWTKITTTVPNQVVTVSQANSSSNNAALFQIHQGWARIYTGDCASWKAGTQNAGLTGASFTVPAPGTYFIGIKYDPKSLAGTPVPVPATITYDFSTSLGGSTGASVLLKKS